MTNTSPKTFPRGQSIEIIKSSFFKQNFKNIKNKKDLEHVTTYFYRNKKNFRIKNIYSKKNLSHLNLCVDDKNDLNKARAISKIIKKQFKSNFYLKNLVKALDKS